MIRINNINLPLDFDTKDIEKKIKKILRVDELISFRIVKQSIDSRKKNYIHYCLAVDAEVENQAKILAKNKNKNIMPSKKYTYSFPPVKPHGLSPVIVGAGPAGLFCGLVLAQNGFKPIIVERGKNVDDRKKDVEKFFSSGKLKSDSNVQFGEGGAGAFSDGKLTTGTNDSRIRKVLDEFVKHGAPEEISYQAMPHIGTDYLSKVVKSIREEIISLGGEVRFGERFVAFEVENNCVKSIMTEMKDKSEHIINTNAVVLATGHSARDTFGMLNESGLRMEQKPFAIGARIEHLQNDINFSQYGDCCDKLPPAVYKLWTHLSNGRSVFTFCMCPGGRVISGCSADGQVVTNGMSCFSRDGVNANSALLVDIKPEDFGSDDVLAGMYLQERIERRAFEVSGGKSFATVQKVGDFLADKPTEKIGKVKPTYQPGVVMGRIDDVLPEFVTDAMREAIPMLDRKMKGFSDNEAILTAPETRSSSPVRIIRDNESFQANIGGIFPCGEGAGYAGGIMSAAVDGIKIAESVAKYDKL